MPVSKNKRISIPSWNVRGFNNSVAKRNLREFTAATKPTFIFIQETKIIQSEDSIIDSIWDITNHGWLFSPATGNRGLSGGLISTWDKGEFTMEDHEIKNNWIWTRCSENDNSLAISNFINIYAPHHQPSKIQMWKELQNILEAHPNEGFCFFGDFNCIRNNRESFNCIYRNSDSEKFNDYITTNNLRDVPLTNYSFTWFGHSQKCSKLDRALVSQNWFPDCQWKLEGLGRKHPDHVCLLLYNSEQQDWGPKPCKPFNTWLNNPDLVNIIHTLLSSSGTEESSIHGKLRNVRRKIQEWNVNVKRKYDVNIKKLEADLGNVTKG